MTRFHFRAVTGIGEVVEGQIEEQSQALVIDQVRRQGYLLLAVEPIGVRPGMSAFQRWLRQPVFGSRRVRRRELAVMTRELATLLDAGLTVDQSLRLLWDLAASEAMRRLVGELLQRVEGGSTLASSLGQH